MSPSKILKLNLNEKRLTRRYLVWCYKTTKEELDRVDRYFTQLEVDQFILDELTRSNNFKSSKSSAAYKSQVDEFRKYMSAKKENVLKQKYADTKYTVIHPHYQYLQHRFKAIEKAISRFLGKKALEEIAELYEGEMTKRILEAREH